MFERQPMQIPQLRAIARHRFRYPTLVKSFFMMSMQFPFYVLLKAKAALLGGSGGFSLKKITRSKKGMVTIIASILRNLMMPSYVLFELINIPGSARPITVEMRLIKTPEKVIIGTCSDLNQFRAILLGVLRRKMAPIAERRDPRRHIYGSPGLRKVLSHTPVTFKKAATKKLIFIPFLFMSQLQKKENKVWAMGKKRVLREISTMPMLKVFSIVELNDAKVLTGSEFTSAASAYTGNITNRYLYSFYLFSFLHNNFNY